MFFIFVKIAQKSAAIQFARTVVRSSLCLRRFLTLFWLIEETFHESPTKSGSKPAFPRDSAHFCTLSWYRVRASSDNTCYSSGWWKPGTLDNMRYSSGWWRPGSFDNMRYSSLPERLHRAAYHVTIGRYLRHCERFNKMRLGANCEGFDKVGSEGKREICITFS